MISSTKKFIGIPTEIWIQILLALSFFLARVIHRDSSDIQYFRLLFYANYLVAAFGINYFLLPRYFYTKKYVRFTIGVVVLLVLVILVEELILEKIYFPNTRRGETFPSVLIIFIHLLPMLMVFVGFKFAWDAQRKQTELEQLRSIVAESQLKFLNSQINPHFLFNNLNNLYSYALEQSPKTPQIILELSSLLRYMLYDCREKYVLLQKEIDYLRDFVRLQSLQIEDRGVINFNVDGEVANQRIAPLILIVFVENCFKHSTASLSDQIQIDIDLKVRGNQLKMYCANRYSMEENIDSLSKGIGLENVRERLNLIYPDAHILDISSDGGVYKVQLDITLTDSGER